MCGIYRGESVCFFYGGWRKNKALAHHTSTIFSYMSCVNLTLLYSQSIASWRILRLPWWRQREREGDVKKWLLLRLRQRLARFWGGGVISWGVRTKRRHERHLMRLVLYTIPCARTARRQRCRLAALLHLDGQPSRNSSTLKIV